MNMTKYVTIYLIIGNERVKLYLHRGVTKLNEKVNQKGINRNVSDCITTVELSERRF